MRSLLQRNRIFLLHLSFWVLYFSYRFYDLQEYLGYSRAFSYLGITVLFNIAASYLHYFFILPELFKDKKPIPYLWKVTLLLGVIVSLRIITENQVFNNLMPNESYYKTIKLSRIVSTTWDTMTFLIFTGMIRFTLDWFNLENKKKQLENEKLVAELNYLKAQINPHFLFNTLHNLNYLVYSKSDKATDVIIRLSNIMRYMIYDANKDKVAVQKEIAYMNDYIHLESIRLNQAFNLTFDIEGKSEPVDIAPLIMLTFLENAFKHGVSDQETNCWIKVKLHINKKEINYAVSNRILKSKRNEKSGFGLENVQKRLQLSYPDKHTLSISAVDDVYSINLTLQLA
jgi:LytS/YehU family sensor histidine kinase